jgi:hypothetical protein
LTPEAILHRCRQQRRMEALQSTAIAKPRQGVGNRRGRKSCARLASWLIRFPMRDNPLRFGWQVRQGYLGNRTVSPAGADGERIIAAGDLGISDEMRLYCV